MPGQFVFCGTAVPPRDQNLAFVAGPRGRETTMKPAMDFPTIATRKLLIQIIRGFPLRRFRTGALGWRPRRPGRPRRRDEIEKGRPPKTMARPTGSVIFEVCGTRSRPLLFLWACHIGRPSRHEKWTDAEIAAIRHNQSWAQQVRHVAPGYGIPRHRRAH